MQHKKFKFAHAVKVDMSLSIPACYPSYLYSSVSVVVFMAVQDAVLRGHVIGRCVDSLKITNTSVNETSNLIQY